MPESKSNMPELSEDDIFSIELTKPGLSEDLQARILAATAALPQAQQTLSDSNSKAPTVFPVAGRIVGAMAIAASLALAVIIWSPQGVVQDQPSEPLSTTEFSLAELEFQDSILLQDELLFLSL